MILLSFCLSYDDINHRKRENGMSIKNWTIKMQSHDDENVIKNDEK